MEFLDFVGVLKNQVYQAHSRREEKNQYQEDEKKLQALDQEIDGIEEPLN